MAYLSSRQLAGYLVGGMATVVLTRILGPASYGKYAIALSLALYPQSLADWGIDVYLMRGTTADNLDRMEPQATALLLLFGLGGTGAAIVALPLFRFIPHLADVRAPITAMLALTPVLLLTQVPLARLERNLRYRAVALAELAAQLVFATTAVSLAYAGLSVWSMVIAYAAQQLLFAFGVHLIARHRPRIAWNRADAREILSYGFGYSASLAVWQLRALVVPLIVAPTLGPASAGIVALSVRLADALSFVRSATWRLSLPLFARVSNSRVRMARALSDGMLLQFTGMAVPAVLFSLGGPQLVERVLGARWKEIVVLFPFIACAYMVNAVFSMHSSALYVMRRNWSVTRFHAVHVVLFIGSSAILVHHFGIVGYGIAELCAFPSYFVVARATWKLAPEVDYARTLIWLVALTPALWERTLGPIALIPAPLALSLPAGRRALVVIRQSVTGMR